MSELLPIQDEDVGSTQTEGKTHPIGVVLDKEGKPCRTCTSFRNWAKLPGKKVATTTPSECPPDVERLGNSSWTLLHSIAATYPEKADCKTKSDAKLFLSTFSRLYPCWNCAEDFRDWMKENEPKVDGREDFGRWLCDAHNAVSEKLGKKKFNCDLWQERWITGPSDGRCG